MDRSTDHVRVADMDFLFVDDLSSRYRRVAGTKGSRDGGDGAYLASWTKNDDRSHFGRVMRVAWVVEVLKAVCWETESVS